MSEEKKYAVLMPISIQRCAETCGIENLPDDVAEALAEDASYRIREIVNTSAQFMRRSRRSCLTSKDVSKALKISDIPPVLGGEHCESPTFDYIEEEDIHFMHDDLVELHDLALEDADQTEAKTPVLTSNWFMLDGQVKSTNTSHDSIPEISSALLEYFNYIVTCILGDDKELRQVSLTDLQKNSKIAPLIPYFVNFASNVNAVSHDLEQLSNLLQTISALIMNPYLSLLGYLKPFMTSALYCVLEPLTASINPANDHWLLRDYGARLLAYTVQKYCTKNVKAVEYIKESLRNILSDPTRPLCSHYGAIVTINALGPAAIKDMMCTDLENYYQTSLRIVEEETDCDNVHLKEDAHKVIGAIMQGLQKLHADALESEVTEKDRDFFSTSFSIFNGSLSARLPLYPKKWQASTAWVENFTAKPSSSVVSMDTMAQIGHRFGYFANFTNAPRRRHRFLPISEVFRPYRPCRRKMRISIGGSRPADAEEPYEHTPFFEMSLKISYIGRHAGFAKKPGSNFLNNYLAIIL